MQVTMTSEQRKDWDEEARRWGIVPDAFGDDDELREAVLAATHVSMVKRQVVVATKCEICKETNGEHTLSCPTRWYR